VALGLGEARSSEHRHELRRGVDAHREGPRVALAAGLDERLGGLRDTCRWVEAPLLEQQPSRPECVPVLLGEALDHQIAVHDLDDQPPVGS